MKKTGWEIKPIIISALTLILTVAIGVCIGLAIKGCDGGSKKSKVSFTTDNYKYKTDISDVKDILNTTDEKYLLLVNKEKTVDESYTPDDLVTLAKQYAAKDSIQLQKAAAEAVCALIDEMRANGFDSIAVTSGYRTYTYQESLYNQYINNEKEAHPDWDIGKIEEYVQTYSAKPGTSEHHTGLCVDFITPEMKGQLFNYNGENTAGGVGFAETEEFEWLKDNAHKFGFILRYPEGDKKITGYDYESWHYRFVGVNAASKIYENKITLEEYLK